MVRSQRYTPGSFPTDVVGSGPYAKLPAYLPAYGLGFEWPWTTAGRAAGQVVGGALTTMWAIGGGVLVGLGAALLIRRAQRGKK